MKKIIMLTAILMSGVTLFAQLKVDPSGRIGMGTNYPNSGYKCHIQGDLLLSNYPAVPGYELMLKVGNGFPGTEIGSNADMLAIWSSNGGYNKVYAEDYLKVSDSTAKSNIVTIKGGLDKIMRLNAYHYSIEDNKIVDSVVVEGTRQEFGFMSQEVERIFPEVKITQDMKGYKLMDYDQIIPLTVAAIKEQQVLIEELQEEIERLKSSSTVGGTSDINNSSKTMLFQNKPNPFRENTTIGYEILDKNFRSASVMIFDLNGALLKTHPVQKSGKGELTVNGNELKAGMYIYTLVVNDKEVDTKRMILVN